MKIKFTYFFIIFAFITSNDFGFYYDNSKDEIYLDSNYNNSEIVLQDSKNVKQHYYSSAGHNKFDIEYYSCDTSLNMMLDLIKVEYSLIIIYTIIIGLQIIFLRRLFLCSFI